MQTGVSDSTGAWMRITLDWDLPIQEVWIWNRMDDPGSIDLLQGFEIWVNNFEENTSVKCYTHTGSVATSAESPIVATCGLT
eukprot:2746349-Rhodomonas_salina.1